MRNIAVAVLLAFGINFMNAAFVLAEDEIPIEADDQIVAEESLTTEQVEPEALEEPVSPEASETEDSVDREPMTEEADVLAASVVSSDFTPFLNYAADPMAVKKALGVYETDLSTGAATYNYPIYIPQGRNGIEPGVSLFYNNQSSSADSIVGYGWNLSVGGSISRSQEYGVLEMYDTDEFYLNMNGASGKLEAVSLDDDEHGLYGLKVEEAFYKYEFQSDDSWIVTDQSGNSYYFGQSADSRQDDPDDSSRIAEWYLDEIRDLSGNYVRFAYSEDQGRVYPESIYYTGYGSADSSNDGVFEIDFGLAVRDDWTKWYDKGFEVKTEYLIGDISVYYDGFLVREYDLSYASGENGTRSMLDSIVEKGISLEGDVVTLPETSFEYSSNSSYTFSTSTFYSSKDDGYLIDVNGNGYADWCLEGDSLSSPYTATCDLDFGMSFGSEYTAHFTPSGVAFGLPEEGTFVDMNGDSLPELLAMYELPGYSYNCMYYNLRGSDGPLGEHYPGCMPAGGDRTAAGFRYGDFDGDGLSDLFTGDATSADWLDTGGYIYLNDGDYGFVGSSFEAPVTFSWGADASPGLHEKQDSGARLVDINGDGLTDVLQAYLDYNYYYTSSDDDSPVILYYLNNGDGTFSLDTDFDMDFRSSSFLLFATMSYNYAAPLEDESYSSASKDICMIDFNGDGILDILSGSMMPEVYLWDGIDTWTSYSTPGAAINCTGLDTSGYIGYLTGNDINGDGLNDFISSDTTPSTLDDIVMSNWSKPDLLIGITTSNGAGIDIEYQSALQYANDDGSIANPDLPFAMYTVSAVSIDDGLGNSTDVSYEYSGGAYYKYFDDLKGQFGGFEEVSVYEDGKTTVYSFDIGCDFTELCANGIPDQTLVHVDGVGWYMVDGDYLREITVNVVDAGLCSSVNCPEAYSSYDSDFVSYFESGEDWDDVADDFMYSSDYSNHALMGKPTTTEIYDDSGNLYSRTVNEWSVTDLGDSRYFPHVDQVTDFTFDGESSAREKAVSYTYNSDYGLVMTETRWGEIEVDESDYDVTDYLYGDELYLTKSYAANDSDWVFKIANEIYTDGDGSTLKESEYYYDDDFDLGDIDEGRLSDEYVWLDTDSSWVATHYEYDSYGNVSLVTNPRGYTTTITYDSENSYPAEITNALGQTVYFDINYINGEPAGIIDINGYEHAYLYDGLGRNLSILGPDVDGLTTETMVSYEYDDSSSPRSIREVLTDDTSDGFNSYTYVDGFDREIQTRIEGEDSYAVSDVSYTSRGDVEAESLSYLSGGTVYTSPDTAQPQIEYSYDAVSRVYSTTTPLGTTSGDYSLWDETYTDPMGNVITYHYDSYGNLIQVDEVSDGITYETAYEYDLLGQLTAVTDAMNNVRSLEWDSLGRLTSQSEMHDSSDANYAVWAYSYDENGNLTQMAVPTGYTIDYAYDEIDRIESEDSDFSSVASVNYVYDSATNGVGLVASITDEAGSVAYSYDALGSLVSETRVIDGLYYETSFVNDLLGRNLEINYPSGAAAVYTYDNGNMVESVSFDGEEIITDIDYSEMGQWEEVYYGNGDVTINTYDPDQMYFLTNKSTTASDGSVLQDLTYEYDSIGNVLSIVSDYTVEYGYDDLYRLITATAYDSADPSSVYYDRSYEYDSVGNMIYKSDIGDLLYEETGNANPYAVTQAGSYLFDYDEAGNVLGDGMYDYEYNHKNQMVASDDYSYSYDFAGQRILKEGALSSTYYPNMFYEDDGGSVREYVFVDGVRVMVSEPFVYESGTESFSTTSASDWDSFVFDRDFATDAEVVVFASIQSENGGNDAEADLKNITSSGFSMKIEEDRGSDRSWFDGVHNSEDVSWLAFDMDNLPSGVYGSVESYKQTSGATKIVTFDEPFDEVPVVFAQLQSEKGTHTARVRIISLDETGFEMKVVEDTGNGTSGDWDGWHVTEDIAWIAFDPDDNPFDGESGSLNIRGYWKSVAFDSVFDDTPMVFPMIISENYTDVCIVDLKVVSDTGFSVRVDENTYAGWDGRHLAEALTWFAVGQ